MAFFDGRIIVVCFLASWVDSTGLVSILVFLTRKRLTKSEQWARRTAAHCAFTSCRLPYKRPQGKIKGQGTGTLACFFSFLSLTPFKDGKGSFQPLRIVPGQALYEENGHIKTLHTHTRVKWYNCCESVLMSLYIQIDDRGENPGCCWLFCDFFHITFFNASLCPHCHQALSSSSPFNESNNEDKSS